MIEDPLAITAVLAAVVAFSVWLTRRFAWAEKLSAVLWILFVAAAASNVGWIPAEAPLYDGLIGFSVPLAVCLVLFTVQLRDVADAGLPILVAFAVAALGTVVGVVTASLLLEPWLASVLGADSWKVAGPYTGTYIGGSLNFVALWQGLEIGQRDLFAAANAVDNLTLFPLMAIWIVLPRLLRDRYPVAARWRHGPQRLQAAAGRGEATPLVLADVAYLIALALTILVLSRWIVSNWLDGSVPEILVVTTLALVAAQVPAVRRLRGAWEIGQLAFYLFFAAVGALIDLRGAIERAPVLFVYVAIVIVVHMVIVYGIGRLLRLDLGVLTMASVATKSGPPTVLAMAELRRDWQHLALPGVIVGLVGYAVGNYAGFGVAHWVRALLG